MSPDSIFISPHRGDIEIRLLWYRSHEQGMREREIAKAPTARTAVTRPEPAGRALDSRTAARLGAAYGHSFTHVRIHDDAHGAELAARHQALAVTEGSEIAFAPGAYRPNTAFGDALLAHELAHVQQQREGGEAPGASHERDAHDAAVGAMAHVAKVPGAQTVRPSRTSAIAPQRCGKPSWAPEMPTGTLTPSNGRAFVAAARVDTILSTSPTTGPYLRERITTGRPGRCSGPTPERSAGHVHYHPPGEWETVVMSYMSGHSNPHVDRCDRSFTEQEARAEAPNTAGFREGGELHINEDTAQLTDTLHEGVHRYSHDDYLATLGFHANEGTTELITNLVCAEQAPPLARTPVYGDELAAMRNVVRVIGVAPVLDAYFNGNLDGLRAAMDAGQAGRYAAWRDLMKRANPDYVAANALFAH
jgi:hypothetical protein